MNTNIRLWLLTTLMLALTTATQAQESSIAIGNWQIHLPYNNARSVAEVGDKIYCATDNGFFYYDKTYNTTRPLSKSDGFTDSRISTLRYDSVTKTLLIAYRNTNIDLLRNGSIININDILRKTFTGEKTINHIYFHNKTAYLSCSFGVVLLDLVKLEIKETYGNLGPNGQVLKVYGATILNDSVFLATANGLMAGNTRTNLLDFKNWRRFGTASGLPANTANEPFRTIATFKNNVYAGVNNSSLMRYNNNGRWEFAGLNAQGSDIFSLLPLPDKLIVCNTYNFVLYENPGSMTFNDDKYLERPLEVIRSRDGTFWVADNEFGLVNFIADQHPDNRVFLPNGPAYTSSFKVYSDDKSVFVLGGSYLESSVPFDFYTGFYEYNNGSWKNFNVEEYPDARDFPKIQYLVDAVRNPVNGKLYIASYSYGLLEWAGPGKYRLFNNRNSTLQSEYPNDTAYVRVTSVAADEKGSIWMTTRLGLQPGAPGLHELRPDGTFKDYPMPDIAVSNRLANLLIDDNGYKWMTLAERNSQIVVFDENKNQKRLLTEQPGSGNLPGGGINALVKDNRGEIWIGTAKGVAVIYNPYAVFSATNFNASLPRIENRPLLDGQVVRTIAVDGGNRKWIGTDNGVWLFSENGDEAIHHFTTKNSPLLSDQITDIGINHATGEVFIGTQAGLVSFRGGATITRETPQCSKVFPNPVRPGFRGTVGIADLPNNAVVKITDISGKLVFETQAQGGTATWNLADYNGKRVRSGVYVVMSATPDGSQHCVSKIAVVE